MVDWISVNRHRQAGDRRRRLRARIEQLRNGVRRRIEVDTRALAALRIALGVIILADLIHRAWHLELFYTDAGVYPVAAYEGTYQRFTGLSIHAISGDLWFQQLLFVVAGLFAIALILGYRTRIVGIVSLVLLFSLHARNPAVLNGADRLLRVLLFVALLSPLGERWSIDACRRGSARATVASIPTAALLFQPVVVFTSNAILKAAGTTWYAGEGVKIALANDVMAVYLGDFLVGFPAVLVALNWLWVALLAGSVVFLLLTTDRIRSLFALIYIGAFMGMLATMMVGLFPFVLTASVLPFLMTPFWDSIARRSSVRLSHRLPTTAQLGPLGSPPVERRVLATLRDHDHGDIASGIVTVGRTALSIAGLLVLVWMVAFSASHITGSAVPEPFDSPHLDEQRWGLYTPNPARSYSWFVVEAELQDGSTVDAFGNGAVNWGRPDDASRMYDTFRHRKFMESVGSSGRWNGLVAKSYVDWACVRASAVHDGRVEQVTVYQLTQPSPIDGEYAEMEVQTVIGRHCGSSDSEYFG